MDEISIHAPLTGSDPKSDEVQGETRNFNPRSPYGERRGAKFEKTTTKRFQSTLPLRGATIRLELSNGLTVISIHAPLTGSD